MTFKKAVFDKTKILRRIGKNLPRREGYELWPRQPFRMMRNDGRPLLSMPSNPDAIEVSAAGASW